MNEDIAAQVATRPEQRKRQLENIALNEFDAASEQLRHTLPLTPEGLSPDARLARLRIAARVRAHHIELAKVGARLRRIEDPTGHHAEEER